MKTFDTFLLAVIVCFAMTITSLAQNQSAGMAGGGIQLSSHVGTLSTQYSVGDKVCFSLTARDKNGNVIRTWDQTGNFTTLTLKNSTANTDTSKHSWNADPDGYSIAYITQNNTKLIQVNDSEWSLPSTAFVDGQTDVCLVDTKAEKGVYVDITPKVAFLTKQVSDTLDFIATGITNILVDVTWATAKGDQVYQYRPYEVVVSPRDRYLNVSNQTIRSRFSARFPGEFDNSSPGLSNIFSGDVFITGPTNYLTASRVARVLPTDPLQWIMVFSADDPTISGVSDPYEILTHAPVPFKLLTPVSHTVLNLDSAAHTQVFTWEKPTPADPYTNIQVSRFDPTLTSDVVTYTWVIVDSTSETRAVRIASDNSGALPQLTLNYGQLHSIMDQIAGMPSIGHYSFLWFVEATDGVYITQSDPQPGFYISMNDLTTDAPTVSAPAKLALDQNYPNPFRAATTMYFSTSVPGRVTLKVYDLLGKEIQTVASGQMDAGQHSVRFNANNLPAGMYIYKLNAEGKTFTKRMTILR